MPNARTPLVLATVTALLGSLLIVSAPAAADDFAGPPSDPLFAGCSGPGSDEFDGSSVDPGTWTSSHGTVSASVVDGALVLPTVAHNAGTAPHLQQPLPAGGWEATTQVTVSLAGAFQQAGIMLRENATEWIALSVYYSAGQKRVQFNRGGVTDFVALPSGAGSTYWLRMTSDGTRVSGSYSTDGTTFTAIGTQAPLGAFAPTGIGPVAFRGASSTAPQIDASFDWFRWSPDAARIAACDGPLHEYCAGPGSDEFGGTAVDGAVWPHVVNGPVHATVADGELVLPTVAVNSPAAPFIAQDVPTGQWEATVSVEIAPTAAYQQAGLMLWESASEWVALDVYYSGQRRVQFNRAGVSASIALPTTSGPRFWLRMTSDGSHVRGSYSTDGSTFQSVGSAASLGAFAPNRIGPTAFRGATSSAPEIDANFDWFRWSPVGDDCAGGGEVAPEFVDARERWRELLIGSPTIDPGVEPFASVIASEAALATGYLDSITVAGEPWADLATSDQAQSLTAFRRLKAIATSWATPGSPLHGDARALAETLRVFDWMIANRYNATTPDTGNWWYLEIGFPLEVNELAVILYDELDADVRDDAMDAIDVFSPTVGLTGANRVWKAMVVGLRGIIVGDAGKVAQARDQVGAEFEVTPTGDGFHWDGGFLQHTDYPYTGGYGISFLVNLADLLLLLDGSPWEVVDPDVANVYGWVSDAFDPVMFEGTMMDSVRGREISREYNPDHAAGATTLRAMLGIAAGAPSADGDVIRGIVARHLTATERDDFWQGGSLTELEWGVEALAGSAAPPLHGTWVYNSMGRVIHHGDASAVGIAMSSTRIKTYEAINSENSRSWYTADGMTYLYDAEPAYGGDFWATVNRYRLAGTTVDTHVRSATSGAHTAPTNTFAGGVTGAGGTAAATGMVLDAFGSDLSARKSWFFFGDEVVALGSGITRAAVSGNGWDGAPRRIETVLENRAVASASELLVDGAAAGTTPGTAETHADASWAHLTTGESETGYVLLGDTTLKALTEDRTGTWAAINAASGSSDTRTDRYTTLWVDHGAAPTNAGYGYVLLPGADAAATEGYAQTPGVRVLADTSAVTAVEHVADGSVAANFWSTGTATVARDGAALLSVTGAASVTLERDGDEYVLSVVDPTQARTTPLVVELHVVGASVVSTSPGVTAIQTSPTVQLSVPVSGAKGATFTARIAVPAP
ncbi:polysaccharide lyase family 8 super-sandwich domain-containing protein [Agromyces silvae]|uniref:polysaccharide lyase family 8 super-sandwich domain-containing protein n=1 Tax=Agromyces silvae TaxID=3388266 RepID=UPI00280AA987|nr:polysaccharide lyase family 8 super-sandwich domain-containing protein [Agromyces protaetiae]